MLNCFSIPFRGFFQVIDVLALVMPSGKNGATSPASQAPKNKRWTAQEEMSAMEQGDRIAMFQQNQGLQVASINDEL